MKVRMLLAEAATTHPDGTMSILRSGITKVWGKEPPIQLQACLAIRVDCDIADAGDHQFDIRCMDADGQELLPKLAGQFTVPPGGAVQNLTFSFSAAFHKPVNAVFVMRIDNVECDRWSLDVVQSDEGPKGVRP